MPSRALSVHIFCAYFALMVLSSFFSYGATYPLFSWKLFDRLGDYTNFFDVRVTTETRSCLLSHCFSTPRERSVAWALIQKIGTPTGDPCKGNGETSPIHMQLLKNQILNIFHDEKVLNAELVSIENSFTDYITNRVTDDKINQKTCNSF